MVYVTTDIMFINPLFTTHSPSKKTHFFRAIWPIFRPSLVSVVSSKVDFFPTSCEFISGAIENHSSHSKLLIIWVQTIVNFWYIYHKPKNGHLEWPHRTMIICSVLQDSQCMLPLSASLTRLGVKSKPRNCVFLAIWDTNPTSSFKLWPNR